VTLLQGTTKRNEGGYYGYYIAMRGTTDPFAKANPPAMVPAAIGVSGRTRGEDDPTLTAESKALFNRRRSRSV
jgi:hypothetical protein